MWKGDWWEGGLAAGSEGQDEWGWAVVAQKLAKTAKHLKMDGR